MFKQGCVWCPFCTEPGISITFALIGPLRMYSSMPTAHRIFLSFQHSGKSNSRTSVFDLGIRHALIDRGEVYYNDRPADLAADLHDLEVQASFNDLLRKYSGSCGYENGRLVYGAFQPVAHSFEAQFEATPDTLDVTESKVTFGDSQVALSAKLRNYNRPDVQGRYDITVDGKQMADMLHDRNLPVGMVAYFGLVAIQADYESLCT